MTTPLIVSPLEASEISASAMTPRTKYSGPPMTMAKSVMGLASTTKDSQPMMPPANDAAVAMPSAVPALPCRVSG